MKTHKIKLNIEFCDDVLSGRKNFEIRFNDRGYQAGDLVQFIPVDGSFTENHEIQYKTYEITYVLGGWGLKEGYVVFGIKPYKELPDCTDCILDGTDACPRGAGRAVDSEVCEEFLKEEEE